MKIKHSKSHTVTRHSQDAFWKNKKEKPSTQHVPTNATDIAIEVKFLHDQVLRNMIQRQSGI